ncbi:hypothetical protein [Bacteroides sp.]|uniref:hypothetical protein n=1 Tax=Bacteroides TaxID=816 RepID=UPI0025C1040D|nr:hypothetical protein [Bacteroides sp.]
MKTIRMIQNVMIGVGIVTAIALVDGLEVSATNKWAAFVIAALAMLTVIEREIRTGNK